MLDQITQVKMAIIRVFRPDYFETIEVVKKGLDAAEEGIKILNGDRECLLQLTQQHGGHDRRKVCAVEK